MSVMKSLFCFLPVGSRFTALKLRLTCVVLAGALVACDSSEDSKQSKPKSVLPELTTVKAKAESGDAEAQWLVGSIYAEGIQLKQDYNGAVEWFRKAADQGHPKAAHRLGSLLEIGQGAKLDYAEAAKWYQKAADQGLAVAQYSLAAMYGLGRGVPYNPKEALALYNKAAAQGDALSRFNLAERFERGRDVEVDLVEAYKWYELAAESGLEDGKTGANALKKRLIATQLEEAKKRLDTYRKSLSTPGPTK